MKKLLWLSAPLVLALGVMAGGVAGFAAPSAPPTAPPGQGDCSHGNTGKVCKPDPQPEQGKDCDTHGNDGIGGVNEDHCLGTSPTTSTDVTSTSQTTTDQTTTNGTTSSTTTNEATTPVTTTPTDQVTTSSQTATTPVSGTVTTVESPNDGPSAAAPAVTKPQLAAALAKQAAKVGTGRVSPERNAAGQLPFTGSSAWILALLGSAMLAAGLGVRRLTA
jgi:hypothetical protein